MNEQSKNEQDGDDERRVEPRIRKINLVQVSRFDEDGFRADLATGRTLNLSTGGLRLELYHALPLRSRVRLDLVLGDDLINVEGVVVYLEAVDAERCAMGIAFSNLPESAARLIERSLQ